MRKTIGLLIALIMFSSVSFGADDMTLFVHVNKTDEKVVDINKSSNEINENDEILIISQNGIKIKRTGKDKDYAICSSREKTDKSDVDKLCNSIFGTSTSAKAITTNATTGVIGNVVLGVVSLGIAPIFGGINYAVYEDVDKLNKFIENNNLKFCFSNLEEEYKLRKKYAPVADMVRIPNYAYNDPLFTQKLNEQIPTLDKALALKTAEQERIAAAKKAEEEVKRVERERMAAVKKVEIAATELKLAASRQEASELFEKFEYTKKDGFGDVVKKESCKIFTLKTKEEVAQFYKVTWNNPFIFNMDDYFLSTIGTEAMVAAAQFNVINEFSGKEFSMEDLSLQKEGVKLSGKLSSNAIVNALAWFSLKAGERVGKEYKLTLKKKHVQLLQAYIVANNLTNVSGSENEVCRYWPKKSSEVLSHMLTILTRYSRDKAAVKLLFILSSENTEDEKIQILLKQPGVKIAFDIISSSN